MSSETSISSARASVMLYDDNSKKWLSSGSSSGLSRVHIYQHIQNNTFRVVGRKLQDNEVLIDCAILKGLEYNQTTPTFHQLRDNKQVYGLNFSSKEEADAFAMTMIKVLDVLNQNLTNNMINNSKMTVNSGQQPVYGHIGTPDDYLIGGGGQQWNQNQVNDINEWKQQQMIQDMNHMNHTVNHNHMMSAPIQQQMTQSIPQQIQTPIPQQSVPQQPTYGTGTHHRNPSATNNPVMTSQPPQMPSQPPIQSTGAHCSEWRKGGREGQHTEALRPEYSVQLSPNLDLEVVFEKTLVYYQFANKDMVEKILGHFIKIYPNITFDSVSEQSEAIKKVKNNIMWPLLRPDMYKMYTIYQKRAAFLFGPPGNGKTLLAKALATELNKLKQVIFFNINPSTLTSEWINESEDFFEILLAVAKAVEPSVIFIDDIDVILSERIYFDSIDIRRIEGVLRKEFETRSWNSIGSKQTNNIWLLVATNRPNALFNQRFIRKVFEQPNRIQVPLPNKLARISILQKLLAASDCKPDFGADDWQIIATETEQFSYTDLSQLVQSMIAFPTIRGLIKGLTVNQLKLYDKKLFRKIKINDFEAAIEKVGISTSDEASTLIDNWIKRFNDLSL